jgi:hypothetical protein
MLPPSKPPLTGTLPRPSSYHQLVGYTTAAYCTVPGPQLTSLLLNPATVPGIVGPTCRLQYHIIFWSPPPHKFWLVLYKNLPGTPHSTTPMLGGIRAQMLEWLGPIWGRRANITPSQMCFRHSVNGNPQYINLPGQIPPPPAERFLYTRFRNYHKRMIDQVASSR